MSTSQGKSGKHALALIITPTRELARPRPARIPPALGSSGVARPLPLSEGGGIWAAFLAALIAAGSGCAAFARGSETTPPSGCATARGATADGAVPFRPAWWAKGPHAQTVWASILRPAPSLKIHRQRWETPDGDFIDVDRVSGSPMSPILIVLHGLEGSARSRQVLGLLAAAQSHGWRGIGVNFRSCSGEPNRLRRSYHGGETSDLAWVIQRVIADHPGSPMLCAGVSLGGNVLLKYLGEQGESLAPEVRAAVAISTPFDLAASAKALERGFSRVYMTRLVGSLKGKTLAKLKRYPDLVDRRALAAARTLTQFDDAVTAPVHGFKNAADYWNASSSATFLPKIRRPTLLINARDDPFLPEEALPLAAVSANRFLTAEFTSFGGHVGFLTGPWPGWPACWAEDRAIRFLESYCAAGTG